MVSTAIGIPEGEDLMLSVYLHRAKHQPDGRIVAYLHSSSFTGLAAMSGFPVGSTNGHFVDTYKGTSNSLSQ